MGTFNDISLYSIRCDGTDLSLHLKKFVAQPQCTSLRWCPYKDSIFSVTSLGGPDTGGCLSFCEKKGTKSEIFLDGRSLWTAEWAPQSNYMSLGCSGGAMLMEINTSLISSFTTKSDVFSQQFDNKGNVFINGSRNGKIQTFDVRVSPLKTESHPKVMRQKSSISDLKLLRRDENYLLAESMDGVIGMWDRRQSKLMKSFQGMKCEIAHLKFDLDEKEEFLFAGDADKKLRIWNLHSPTVEPLRTFDVFNGPINTLKVGDYWNCNRVPNIESEDVLHLPGVWIVDGPHISYFSVFE